MNAAHDPADLQRIYDARFSSNIEYRKRVWEALCGDWFQRFVGEKVTIFDVGYGYGELSNAVRAGAESDEQSLRHRPSNAHRAALSQNLSGEGSKGGVSCADETAVTPGSPAGIITPAA